MAVRSAELASGVAPTSAVVPLATVPAGETWIVKDIRVWSSAGTGRCYVGIERGGLEVGLVDNPVPGPSPRGLDCWVVLEPGDVIEVYSQTNVSSVWVSGAKLIGVA